MRFPLLAACALALAPAAFSQAPGRQQKQVATRQRERVDAWALQLGAVQFPFGESAGVDQIFCCAPTPAGGMVVAGSTFGALAEANTAGRDLFVARISPFGHVTWLRQLGDVTVSTSPALAPGADAAASVSPRDVVIDTDGTILVTGNVSGTLGEPHAGFGGDTFVARFAADGTLLWLTQLGAVTTALFTPTPGATSWGSSTGQDSGNRILLDPSGGLWVAGTTSSSYTEASEADATVFLAHFTAGGVLDGMTELGEVTGAALGFPGFGDFCGATGLVATANGPLMSVTSSVLVGANVFYSSRLVAYDAAGAPVSTTVTPGTMDTTSGMVADAGGSVYVSGATYELIFDLQYETDAMVARYEPSTDTWTWWTRLDAALGATLGLIDLTGSDVTSGVALAPGGTLVVAGTTKSAMDQPGGGSNDVFTLRLSRADGTVQQVRQLGAGELHFGTAGSDSALDACAFPDGSIGVVGTTTGSFAETSGGASDAFALRLRPDGGL